METLTTFLEKFGPEVEIKEIPERKDHFAKGWRDDIEASHYEFLFYKNGLTYVGYFSQGSSHTKPPTKIDILACCLSDYYSMQESFEDYCSSFDRNNDSIEELKDYTVMKEMSQKFQNVVGIDFIEECEKLENDY